MKKKKHLFERLPAVPFILLFTLITSLTMGLGFYLSNLIMLLSQNFNWTFIRPFAVISPFAIVISTLLTVLGQSALLKFQYEWSARKWLIASVTGITLIYLFYFALFVTNYAPPLAITELVRRLPLLILAVAQFTVLRQYVKHAWLWVLITVAIGFINLPPDLFITISIKSAQLMSLLVALLVGSIRGIILATVMTILVRLTMQSDRKQFEEQSKESEDTSRLEEHYEQVAKFSESNLQEKVECEPTNTFEVI